MLKCPSCGNALEQDFGMVTCGNCQAVLMIDITGEVQMAVEKPALDEQWAQAPADEEPDKPDTEGAGRSAPPEDSEHFANFASVENFTGSTDLESLEGPEDFTSFHGNSQDAHGDVLEETFANGSAPEAMPDSAPLANDEQMPQDTSTDSSDWADEALSQSPLLETAQEDEGPVENQGEGENSEGEEFHFPVEEESSEDFSMAAEPDTQPVDVTGFANSEGSSLEEGEYLYDIMISRLDSKNLREALKYVLLDDKLKLNHHEYLKNIKDGKVTIPSLNPIKAKRIVEQLQYENMDVQWLQKRVVMQSLEPEVSEAEDE